MPNYIFPLIPDAAKEAVAGGASAKALSIETYLSEITTTGAQTFTLADASKVGHLKKVLCESRTTGDGTLTPTTFADGTSLTFAAAGEFAVLMWTGDAGWRLIESGDDANGDGSGPAIVS